MDIEQLVYSNTNGWAGNVSNLGDTANLVYVFGSRENISEIKNLKLSAKSLP